MKNIIKKVPVPLCGVMLGLAALGNLLQSYSEGIRYVCGIAAAFLLILILLKLVMFPQMIKEDLKNPIMASVAGTFSMALMILSTYVKPFIGQAAFVIWIAAIILHIVLIIWFTAKFIVKLQMPKVFASYYIVYVGIAVAAVTAPARPLICIYAAPMSLCFAGYVQSVTPKSRTFLLAMLAVASVLYLFALVKAIGYLRLKFYPSYAAFTFPFVISAIATKQTMACCMNMGQPLPWLKPVVLVETIIAVVLVVYTFIRFMGFIFSGNK